MGGNFLSLSRSKNIQNIYTCAENYSLKRPKVSRNNEKCIQSTLKTYTDLLVLYINIHFPKSLILESVLAIWKLSRSNFHCFLKTNFKITYITSS